MRTHRIRLGDLDHRRTVLGTEISKVIELVIPSAVQQQVGNLRRMRDERRFNTTFARAAPPPLWPKSWMARCQTAW